MDTLLVSLVCHVFCKVKSRIVYLTITGRPIIVFEEKVCKTKAAESPLGNSAAFLMCVEIIRFYDFFFNILYNILGSFMLKIVCGVGRNKIASVGMSNVLTFTSATP